MTLKKITALLGVLFLTLTLNACSPGHAAARNRYFADKELFIGLAEYFKSLYTENLSEACINPKYGDDGVLTLEYKNSGGEIFSEKLDISSESVYKSLSALRDKYVSECEYPLFSFADARYDDAGNMLLRLRAHAETLENADIYGYYFTNYYLIYADRDYDGNGFYMSFDSVSLSQNEPFSDNWYIWSEKAFLG